MVLSFEMRKRLDRRNVLQALAAAGTLWATDGGRGIAGEPLAPCATTGPGLRDLASARGLYFGTAVKNLDSSAFRDPAYRAAVVRDCNILVPEYALKWKEIDRGRGHYDFSAPDALLAFAEAHGMAFRGHPLIWYKSNPIWFDKYLRESPAPARSMVYALMRDHIERVVGHYRGRVQSWDVVNEIFEEDRKAPHPREDGLRESLWLKHLGPDYVGEAFRIAHAADPGALLVLNELALSLGFWWRAEAPGAIFRLHNQAA